MRFLYIAIIQIKLHKLTKKRNREGREERSVGGKMEERKEERNKITKRAVFKSDGLLSLPLHLIIMCLSEKDKQKN